MTEFTVTSPEGKQYRITAPEGTSKDDALAHFQKEMQGDTSAAGAREAAASRLAGGVKKDPEKVKQWSSAEDFFKSIPGGMTRGLAGTASAMGQAEEGLQTAGQGFGGRPGLSSLITGKSDAGMQVPGVEQSYELAQKHITGPQHQPQGFAGRVGAGVGEAAVNPMSYMPMGGGPMRQGLSVLGSVLGGQAGQELGGPVGAFVGGMAGGGLSSAGGAAKTLAATRGRGMFPMPQENPVREAFTNTLEKFGIQPKAGDVLGRRVVSEAEKMGGQPFGGSTYAKTALQPEIQATQAAAGMFGEMEGRIGPEVLERSKNRIANDFNQAEKVLRIKGTKNLEQLTKDAVALRLRAANRLSKEDANKISGLIDDILPQEKGERWFINKKTGEVEMSGDAYASFTKHNSDLDRAIHSENSDISHYALQVRNMIDDALERTATGKGTRMGAGMRKAYDQFQQARKQYFNRLMVSRSLADPKEPARVGLVDMEKLYGNLKKNGWEGDIPHNDIQRLAQAGHNIMTNPYREPALGAAHDVGSGRAVARDVGHLGAAALGGAAGLAMGGPIGGAIGLTAGAALPRIAPGVAGRVVNHPAVQRYLTDKKLIDAARKAKAQPKGTRGRSLVRGAIGASAAQDEDEGPEVYKEQ